MTRHTHYIGAGIDMQALLQVQMMFVAVKIAAGPPAPVTINLTYTRECTRAHTLIPTIPFQGQSPF